MTELQLVKVLWERGKLFARTFGSDDRGFSAEAVILTAIFVTLAITVGAIIVAKVTAKANSISTS